jgi:outer membrane immunogenic protein
LQNKPDLHGVREGVKQAAKKSSQPDSELYFTLTLTGQGRTNRLLTVVGRHMHKFFLRFALLSAAVIPAASALAADLDVMPPPPPPPVEELRPATYDWSGAYVGAWVGATCIDGFLHDNSVVAPANGDWEMDGCGGKGGVMAGYLHQFDNFVVGAEVDWGMSGEVAKNETPSADFAFKMNHLVTGRARAGYAFDDTLLYATGGMAWTQGELYGINGYSDPDHIKVGHYGWVIGGGMEHALTDQFRLRLEYTYTRFKGENYNEGCCDVDVDSFGDHEIKIGGIWAF